MILAPLLQGEFPTSQHQLIELTGPKQNLRVVGLVQSIADGI